MKRFITFLMAFVMVASMAVTCISAAEQPKSMLVLGDSITTGYGLDNYIGGGTPYNCRSYANIIAEGLGLEGGKTYINKAVNGDTSTDLLALLPALSADLAKAELIIVTVGGNDLLQAIPVIASAISGKTVTKLEEAVNILLAVSPEKYNALALDPAFQGKMMAVLTKYATNLSSIATGIKAQAPNARVIFLKQYNPMKNVSGFTDFANFADTMIGSINNSMDTVCNTVGFETVDVPSVINANAAGLTNILDYDIHPNAQGHIEIAKMLGSHLGITLNIPEDTVPSVTEPPAVTEHVHDFTISEYSEVAHWFKCAGCGETDNVIDHTFGEDNLCTVCGYKRYVPETDPETDPVTEPETDPLTEAPAATEAPAEEKGGCASSVSAVALISACACAFVFIKKKSI